MHKYSPTAWRIASLYSGVLASETRDLAAHIDAALARERERCATAALEQRCERETPWDLACTTIAAKIRELPVTNGDRNNG
jgi:hypothetical protein